MRGENWEYGSVRFKFQLGDIVFGRVALSLVRRSARLGEGLFDLGDTPGSAAARRGRRLCGVVASNRSKAACAEISQ
jgi:hypothetical protein